MEPERQRFRLHRNRGPNPRGELPDIPKFHHLPIKEIVAMVLQVHVWTADLRRYDQNHGVDRHNRDYNSVILEKAVATVDLHGRACDFAVKTKYVFAHGVLEL